MKYLPLRGFSLIELLIATTLSLILSIGLFTIYLSNKRNYQFNEALARIQENGRTAVQRLQYDVRMANKITATPDNTTLFIQEADPNSASVTTVEKNKITVDGYTDFKVEDILQINNCAASEIIQVKNIVNHKGSQTITVTVPVLKNLKSYIAGHN